MTPSLQTPRELLAGRRSELMAIHFAAAPFSESVLAWYVLLSGFRVLLRNTVLMPQAKVGAHGSFQNGLIIFDAANRTRAAALTLEFFPLFECAMEIAWLHAAEDAWITLHPNPAALPFERHLTDDQYQIRDALSDSSSRALQAAMKMLGALPPDSTQS